ncbi:nectin-1-like [Mantella aurantiaca]
MIRVLTLLVLEILRLVGGQEKVDNYVNAWLRSDAVVSCSVKMADVKQITLKRKENGHYIDFLTYGEVSGVKKLTRFAEERVEFLGNGLTDGSIKIRNVTLADESLYTCIFTVFPSGAYLNTTSLVVLAKPDIMDPVPDLVVPTLTYKTVATCVAAAAKPAANIAWRTGGLNYTSSEEEVRHDNQTVTTRSRLNMMAGAGLQDHSVTCIISQSDGTSVTQAERNITIQNIQYPPDSVRVEVNTLANGDVQFICLEDSRPPATNFTWKRKETFHSNAAVELGNGKTLSTESLPTGLYICEVTNLIGKSSGYLYLYRPPGPPCLNECLWPVLFLLLLLAVLLCWHFKNHLMKCKEKQEVSAVEDQALEHLND